MRRYLFVLMMVAGYLSALETLVFSSTTVKNGESILVVNENNKDISDLTLHFEKRDFPFFTHPFNKKKSYLLLPVSYYVKPGSKSVEISYRENGEKIVESLPPIFVSDGNYKTEKLNVDPGKIKLSKRDRKRVDKEYEQAMKIYNTYSDQFRFTCDTCLPMDSNVTSDFGNERLFNGIRKSYHSGIDFRAKTPQSIRAVGHGSVVLRADRFYAGYSLIIDHGQGIYSGYYHLSDANVDVGDSVEENQIIAKSGRSGRVTGPHLHFSMKVHGVTVNPVLLLRQIDSLVTDSL